MCTYLTEQAPAFGSGKGPDGWFPVSQVTVYFDHPVHASPDHTLNIDLANPALGPASRVAVELSAESALQLARLIVRVLEATPAEITGLDPERLASP